MDEPTFSSAGTGEPVFQQTKSREKYLPIKKSRDRFDSSLSNPVGDKCFNSNNEKLSALFGSTDEETSQYGISLKTHTSNVENCESSSPAVETVEAEKNGHSVSANTVQDFSEDNDEGLPSKDKTHQENLGMSNLGDGETTNNELNSALIVKVIEEKDDGTPLDVSPLTLVDCSIMCLPVESVSKKMRRPWMQAKYFNPEEQRLAKKSVQETGISGTRAGKSQFRGIARHKWTGKYEAHLWDRNRLIEGHTRKGKQVYLGSYETAEEAAQAYDLAMLKFWGPSCSAKLNFPVSNYESELQEKESISKEELVTYLRRQSLSTTRGSSIYRGVTRNRNGPWQARIRVASHKKDVYLGTYSSEEDAARAYDIAAIRLKGVHALTNFDISDYSQEDLKRFGDFPEPKRAKIESLPEPASTTETLALEFPQLPPPADS